MPSSKFWRLATLVAMAQTVAATDPCTALTSLSLENTTIVSAFRQTATTNVTTPMSCALVTSIITSADVCRVQGYVNTTSDSSLTFEAWLPDTWYGRFIGVGNSGLGGCTYFSFQVVS